MDGNSFLSKRKRDLELTEMFNRMHGFANTSLKGKRTSKTNLSDQV